MIDANTILVTGGAGFIGSAIAHRLVDSKNVIVVDNLYNGTPENVPTTATFIEGDLSKDETYDKLDQVGNIDAVLHLAGQPSQEGSFDDPEYDFDSHATSTFKLLEWCQENDINRLLYASSVSVYGEPQDLPVDESYFASPQSYYAAGKRSAEAYINFFNNNGMDNTIFRLFNIYGPGQNLKNRKQGMVSIYLSFVIEDETLTVKGSLDRFRDFVYIDDVVDAWVDAIDSPVTYGNTYNLASGQKTTVEELIDCMLHCYGAADYPIEVTGGTPGDVFGIYGDASKLQQDLNWSPSVSLEQGLNRMIESYRSPSK